MKKSYIFFILLLFLAFFPIFSLFSDVRVEPVDFIIAVDKSKSMSEEIEEVKRYINTFIIDEHLIVDDYFLVITFYRKAEVAAAGILHTLDDKIPLKQAISAIKADGAYTDIGNALDRLKDELKERLNNNRKKHFLLITDGRNEPPRDSKYYSKDGRLTHEYLKDLGDLMVFKNWKVQALAIGGDLNSKDLTQILAADYKEVKHGSTAEDMNAVNPEPLGSMEIVKESVPVTIIRNSKEDVIVFTVKAQRYTEAQKVAVTSVYLTMNNVMYPGITSQPVELAIAKEGTTPVTIPIDSAPLVAPGDYVGTLTFKFATEAKFDPTLEIKIHVNTFFENNTWFLPVAIIVCVLTLILLIFLIAKMFFGKKITFRVEVEERPFIKGKDIFSVSRAKDLYLTEGMDLIRVLPQKNNKSFARLSYQNDKLKLTIVKADRLPEMTQDQSDIMNKTIVLLTENRNKYHIKFCPLSKNA